MTLLGLATLRIEKSIKITFSFFFFIMISQISILKKESTVLVQTKKKKNYQLKTDVLIKNGKEQCCANPGNEIFDW